MHLCMYVCVKVVLLINPFQTNMRPEFASSEGSGEDSAVADGMCDLLAYHDIMDTPPAPLNTTNTTSSPDNTTQSLLALLRLNLEDTCTWVS